MAILKKIRRIRTPDSSADFLIGGFGFWIPDSGFQIPDSDSNFNNINISNKESKNNLTG